MGSTRIGLPGFPSIFVGGGTTVTIAQSDKYVLPIGWYFLKTDANGKLQVISTGTTWTDHAYGAASSYFGPVWSDGTNMRVLNTNAGATSTLLVYNF